VLRQIIIRRLSDGSLIYSKAFTKVERTNTAIELELFNSVKNSKKLKLKFKDFSNFSLVCGADDGYYLALLFDRTNPKTQIKEIFQSYMNQLIQYTKTTEKLDRNKLDSIATNVVQEVPVTVGFIGLGGVGKTTIIMLLSKRIINVIYSPSLGVVHEELQEKIGDYRVILTEFPGVYRGDWNKFIHDMDILFIVTDSSQYNIKETKKVILPFVNSEAPYAKKYVIATKQDLPYALSLKEISKHFNLKIFGLCTIEPESRQKLLNILRTAILG